jgi:hypothetical protein
MRIAALHPSYELRRRSPILPDGQISSPLQLWRVHPLLQKYFGFSEMQIRLYDWPSRPERGALANVINVGWDAVDADGAFDASA